jgi:hypothetical protein
MEQKKVKIGDPSKTAVVFGNFDKNVRIIEKKFGVDIRNCEVDDGDAAVISGEEKAVADAILDGSLYGFGCDVYSTEPFPENHPYSKLSKCDNVILTPHMAWGGYETRVRLVDEVAKNIDAFYNGEERNRIV